MSVTSLSHWAHWRLLPESSSSITGCRVDCYRVNVSLKHRLRSRLHRMLHINATRSQGTLKNNRSVFIFYWVERYQNSSPHTLKSHHSNPVITVNTKNFTHRVNVISSTSIQLCSLEIFCMAKSYIWIENCQLPHYLVLVSIKVVRSVSHTFSFSQWRGVDKS